MMLINLISNKHKFTETGLNLNKFKVYEIYRKKPFCELMQCVLTCRDVMSAVSTNR